MTVQSTFTYDAVRYLSGDLADATAVKESVARIATGAVPFGRLFCRRATPADTDEQGGLPEVSASVTARAKGISVRNQMQKNTVGYEVNDVVTCLRKGRIAVDCETAWTDGADVFWRFTDPGALGLGVARNDADTADAVALLDGRCKFVGSGSGAGIAIVEINLP